MNIKTIIIEDEVNARKALINMLSFYCPEVEIAGHAASVKEGIALIEKTSPNLLLLDVHLPDGTGFDLVKKIKKKDFKIVFITAYDQYALKAIKLSALDYLLKPVKPDELRLAISKVQEAIESEERINLQIDTCIDNFSKASQDKKIILNTIDNLFVIEVKHLIRCEASENYTNIFIEGKNKIMISKTLKEFEEMLSAYGFFRIHQSHLINLQYVDSYEKKGGGNVRLKTGERVPVSTRRKENFLKVLKSIS
jgi:two-component system LytT family response regulator